MTTHRITRTAAIALAIAAAAAPAATARPLDGANWTLPSDFKTADARDHVVQRGIYEPMRPVDQPQPAPLPHYPTPKPELQDMRHPDTVDYANGRGTYNAPEVVVVDVAKPESEPTAGGVDWEDVGLGAGSLLGIGLIGVGGALFVVHRRGARRVAA